MQANYGALSLARPGCVRCGARQTRTAAGGDVSTWPVPSLTVLGASGWDEPAEGRGRDAELCVLMIRGRPHPTFRGFEQQSFTVCPDLWVRNLGRAHPAPPGTDAGPVVTPSRGWAGRGGPGPLCSRGAAWPEHLHLAFPAGPLDFLHCSWASKR